MINLYEVTPIKKCNKLLLQKSETKIFDQKRLHKTLVQIKLEKNLGVWRLNQIIISKINC